MKILQVPFISRALVLRRIFIIYFGVLGVSGIDFSGFRSVRRTDNSFFFQHIDQPSRPGITHPQSPLQKRGGSFFGSDYFYFSCFKKLVIIAIGLSIGALFVRSLTVLMVRRDTLSAYRYLEHGAFWAIIALGAIMLGSVLVEVPEAVTGLIGALLIAAALWDSARSRAKGG